MNTQFTLGSLFAGIGGFDEGFRRAGFETIWAVEIDKQAQGIFRRHFPDAEMFDDVKDVGAHNLAPVDVITFGSPCQDLSVAGKRAGMEGERSGLFYEAIRICQELRPTFAIWENVPGALSSHTGRDFAAALDAFRQLGARDIAWRVLDAQYSGVPQRRRRIFLVADLAGERAAEVLLEPESVCRHPASSGEAGAGAARGATISTLQGGGRRGQRLDAEMAAGGHQVPTSIGFHLTQDPISSDDKTPAMGTGNAEGCATLGVLQHSTQDEKTGSRLATSVAASLRHGGGNGRGYNLDAEAGLVVVDAPESPVGAQSANGVGTCGADDNQAQAGHLLPDTFHSTGQSFYNQSPIAGTDGAREWKDGQTTLVTSLTGERTHALTSEGADAGEDGTGRGTPLVLRQAQNQRGEVRTSEIAAQLSSGGGKPGQGYPAVAITEGAHGVTETSVASSLQSGGGKPGQGYQATLCRTGVRRLTPTECERLMAFPDSWTATDADGRPVSDSARYRLLGNSVVVNVVEWIAHRVAAALVESIPEEEAS